MEVTEYGRFAHSVASPGCRFLPLLSAFPTCSRKRGPQRSLAALRGCEEFR